MSVSVIIAAGGRGERLGSTVPKQLLDIGGRSMLQRSVDAFIESRLVDEIVVVLPPALAADPAALLEPSPLVRIAQGGPRRQDSVASGVRALAAGAEVVLVHDAARPFVTAACIARVIDAARRYGAAVAAVPARDTVKRARRTDSTLVVTDTVPRDEIWLAQTPQGFLRHVLEAAVARGSGGVTATDEAALAEGAGTEVHIVEGDATNVKITTEEDLRIARAVADAARRAPPSIRVGIGYDLHRFVEGRRLVLGGVDVPHDRGLAGHSDADAVAHAVTDAVLGAAGLGDIGRLFPDSDPRWKDADSLELLERAVGLAREARFAVANVDVIVVTEQPKIGPHVPAMRERIARTLGCEPSRVSIKGKTNERVDATGRGEALMVHAVAMLVGG